MESYANIHRGVHRLSVESSEAYEKSRERMRDFLHAGDTREIVFVRGTTEGINLVAQTYGRANVQAGDEVLISALEHHSNIVPWQILCGEKGARLVVAPINERGEIRMDELEKRLSKKTKIVAVSHVSNALGTVNPIREDHRARPRARRAGARGRRAGGAAAPGGRRGARLRLLHALRPQDVRADRRRHPLRKGQSTSRPCRRTRGAAT